MFYRFSGLAISLILWTHLGRSFWPVCLKQHLYGKLSPLIAEPYSNAVSLIKAIQNATFCSVMRPRDGLDDGLHMQFSTAAGHPGKPQDRCAEAAGTALGCDEQSSHRPADSVDEFRTSEL